MVFIAVLMVPLALLELAVVAVVGRTMVAKVVLALWSCVSHLSINTQNLNS